MRNLVIAATMVVAALAAPAGAQAAGPGPHDRDLGGLNLTAYCAHVYGSNYKSFLMSPQTADDWYCVPIIHHAGTVNHHLTKTPMTAACLFEYRLIGVYAKALRQSSGGNWQCFLPTGPGIHPL
jgi:hypothetical protein